MSSHFLQVFPPGCPTVDILQRFLSTCESLTSPSTAFAVHCRSGLGRTATVIGAFAIRHCGFTARAWVKAEFDGFFCWWDCQY
jgi:protein-tyrosine phosphatase